MLLAIKPTFRSWIADEKAPLIQSGSTLSPLCVSTQHLAVTSRMLSGRLVPRGTHLPASSIPFEPPDRPSSGTPSAWSKDSPRPPFIKLASLPAENFPAPFFLLRPWVAASPSVRVLLARLTNIVYHDSRTTRKIHRRRPSVQLPLCPIEKGFAPYCMPA